MAGLTEIPAVIREMEDQEAALVSLVENLQREDLNFIEEARAYKSLMDDFGLTQDTDSGKSEQKTVYDFKQDKNTGAAAGHTAADSFREAYRKTRQGAAQTHR